MITVKELEALTLVDHGRRLSLGASMYGAVRAVDGGVAVYVSWRYKFCGRSREMHLGTWRRAGDTSLKALRSLRDGLALQCREGVDPIEVRRTDGEVKRAELEQQRADAAARLARIDAERCAAQLEAQRQLTVRALFNRWAATELAPRIGTDGRRIGRKDGGEFARAQFERRVFPALGDVAVSAIRKSDLLAILDRAKAEGKLRTANMLLADLKQMFRFALVREVVDRNPLDTVTKRDVGGNETERNRVLTADEVAALAAAVPGANMSARSEAAMWLILATGCRVREVLNKASSSRRRFRAAF